MRFVDSLIVAVFVLVLTVPQSAPVVLIKRLRTIANADPLLHPPRFRPPLKPDVSGHTFGLSIVLPSRTVFE